MPTPSDNSSKLQQIKKLIKKFRDFDEGERDEDSEYDDDPMYVLEQIEEILK